MLIAQMSDTHVQLPGGLLDRNYDTAGNLARAVRHLNGCTPQPDVVLLTGDAVDSGAPAEYGRLRDILADYEFDRREAFLRIHYSMAMLKKVIEELTLESVRDCTKDVWFGELDDVSVADMFERFIDQHPEAYPEGYVFYDDDDEEN